MDPHMLMLRAGAPAGGGAGGYGESVGGCAGAEGGPGGPADPPASMESPCCAMPATASGRLSCGLATAGCADFLGQSSCTCMVSVLLGRPTHACTKESPCCATPATASGRLCPPREQQRPSKPCVLTNLLSTHGSLFRVPVSCRRHGVTSCACSSRLTPWLRIVAAWQTRRAQQRCRIAKLTPPSRLTSHATLLGPCSLCCSPKVPSSPNCCIRSDWQWPGDCHAVPPCNP